MLERHKNIHFIGIGGIGMSSIAAILLERGFNISGSDVKPNRLIEAISRKGASVCIGHSPLNIPGRTGLVVYSTSISPDNPEMVAVRQRGIRAVHRSDIVSEIINASRGVAVTGAHGKTTTTALSSLLLTMAGLDPTVIVGGELDFLGGNWRNGKGNYAVCEADESDGTFKKLRPAIAILTNIDHEHMEHYKDFEDLLAANRAFIDNIKKGGLLITSYDDENIKKILKGCRERCLKYSLQDKKADIYPEQITMKGFESSFKVIACGKDLGLFKLNIPGRHNIQNSLAVILLGLELGIDAGIIRDSLSRYRGALRRFEVKADIGGITVIEDYAHHPTEIRATISCCKNWPGRRIIGIFQPHRYTRTSLLKEEFGKCFLGLDELILTDIYSASEKPLKGVTAALIYDEAVKNGQKKIRLLAKEKILSYLSGILKKGDMVIVMGAGDIGELSYEIVKWLKDKGQDPLQRTVVQAHNI
ncbi:MAG: UDP-N-acetylmuramate--L-alanine ligase [Candidatus Omnitrophica bacterium]|nr:UDP-N-acetylmuramate--L-alanine ligase [Candidatus Omnitrophota bacterium]